MSGLNRTIRWKRRMRGEDGVASVIGTIFALLVFITLLGLIVTSYIPSWEKENEQEFMTETLYRFSMVKSVNGIMGLDDQQFVAIPLAPSKVPIFGKTVLGNLTFNPSGVSAATISVSFNSNDTSNLVFDAGGSLEYMILVNSQLNQRVSYEMGGVIKAQPDGQLMRNGPTMTYNVTDTGSGDLYGLTLNLMELIGVQSSRVGIGTFGVSMTVTQLSQFYFEMGAGDRTMTMVITSAYPEAWANWLDLRFVQTGVISPVDINVVDNEITVDFSNLQSITIKKSKTVMSLE